jgi:hypothetical protein
VVEQRGPPSPAAPRRRRWRFPTTTSLRRGGISGQACPHQPSSPRRGAREEVGWPHGGRELEAWRRGLFAPHQPPCLERPSGEPGTRAGAHRRTAPSLRRRPRGAVAMGGAPRPQRLAQPGIERGAADPRRPSVACLQGASAFVNLSLSSLLCCFRVCFCGAALMGPCLLVAGAGASCPPHVRRLRPDER